MREIKFSFMYTDGSQWLDQRFDMRSIMNGEPFDVVSDSPLLREFRMVAERQYTGLKDKNGVEIYEGDVLKTWEYGYNDGCMGDKQALAKVDWACKHAAFTNCIDKRNGVEVIGNIYENPELLGGEE